MKWPKNLAFFVVVFFSMQAFNYGCGVSVRHKTSFLTDEEIGTLYRVLNPQERGIKSFATKGVLEVRSWNLPQELRLLSAVKLSPFLLRADIIAQSGIPVMTILSKDGKWRIINYLDKTVVESNEPCRILGQSIELCVSEDELRSILFGEPILLEIGGIRSSDDMLEISQNGKKLVYLVGYDRNANLPISLREKGNEIEIQFSQLGKDSDFKRLVNVRSESYGALIVYKIVQQLVNIDLEAALFEEPMPAGFRVTDM
jgi:hypothetical protein